MSFSLGSLNQDIPARQLDRVVDQHFKSLQAGECILFPEYNPSDVILLCNGNQ